MGDGHLLSAESAPDIMLNILQVSTVREKRVTLPVRMHEYTRSPTHIHTQVFALGEIPQTDSSNCLSATYVDCRPAAVFASGHHDTDHVQRSCYFELLPKLTAFKVLGWYQNLDRDGKQALLPLCHLGLTAQTIRSASAGSVLLPEGPRISPGQLEGDLPPFILLHQSLCQAPPFSHFPLSVVPKWKPLCLWKETQKLGRVAEKKGSIVAINKQQLLTLPAEDRFPNLIFSFSICPDRYHLIQLADEETEARDNTWLVTLSDL